MKRKEKAILEDFSRKILLKLRAGISQRIVEYLAENDGVVNSFKLQKLRYAFEKYDGDGSLLLPYSRLQRVKFFERGAFSRSAFIVPISAAEDFLAVWDCKKQEIRIEEVPPIAPILF